MVPVQQTVIVVVVTALTIDGGRRTVGETQSIDSIIYKNLRLKKEGEKKKNNRRVAFKESSSHVRYSP